MEFTLMCILMFVVLTWWNSTTQTTKLSEIADSLKDIHDLMKANSPNQVEKEDDNVPLKELCRRHRVKLEVAQATRRRRG